MLNLDFHPFPELETERLLLRQIEPGDASQVFFLRSDPSVLLFLNKEPAKSIKEAKEFIAEINADIDENEVIMWGIVLRSDPGELLGTVCFWHIQKEHDRAELGYVLHPGYWEKGIMKEALTSVISYGFSSLKFHSLEAYIHPGNQASAALLESLRFKREGHLKENVFFRDKYEDTVIYSLLVSNWYPSAEENRE